MERTPLEFAQDIFNSLYGFVAVDAEGKIAFIGEQYALDLGTTTEEALGKPIEQVIANTRLPVVLKTRTPEWGSYMQAQSAITENLLGKPTLCNRILIYSGLPGEDQQVVGAVAYGAVTSTQDQQLLFAELDSLRQQNQMFHQHIAQLYQADTNLDKILGASAPISQLKSMIRQVADTAVAVCVYGETGTGKELVANAIHKLSRRRDKPFIKINCAAIPKDLLESELFGYEAGAFSGALRQGKVGMFELADGGTLLLDEIGDLPLTLQAKLLRVLQDGELRRVGGVKSIPVNVRLICSTNRNLKSMVDTGDFRADLYFRINTIELLVPPLRDRTEDIPALTNHFIHEANERNGSSISGIRKDTFPILAAYPWPGNVRELEHTVERACVLCGSGVLGPEHFSLSAPGVNPPAPAAPSLKTKTNFLEQRAILDALEACHGNKRAAADMLKITRATLYSKLRKYNIPL